jgi:Fur family peroxide stress response transcriptional regulator
MKTTDIVQRLREHELKVTPQRLKIVESLNTFGHLNIDMLYSEVKSTYPNVSLATVYKNLSLMTKNGLLNEVKVPDTKSVYEVAKEPHLHLYCDVCEEIMDITIDISGIETAAGDESGYRIEKTSVVMRGICPACQRAG